MFAIIFGAFCIVGALVHLGLSKQPRTAARALQIFLLWALINTGIGGIFAFMGHVFLGPEVAKSIGWPPGSPFQFEVGMANLGIGVLGIICIWRRDFWLPTIVMTTVFLWGAAYIHIDQIIRFRNFAPNNAGIELYADLIGPAVLIGLYTAYRLATRSQQQARPQPYKEAA